MRSPAVIDADCGCAVAENGIRTRYCREHLFARAAYLLRKADAEDLARLVEARARRVRHARA